MEPAQKMQKIAFDVRKISSYRSRYPKYSTNEHVSKFIINNLGDDPLNNLAEILKGIVDEAFEGAKKDYGRYPHMYVFLLDGFGINDPIKSTAYSRENDFDILMIMEEVEKLAQSDKLLDFLNNIINVSIITVNMPAGSKPKPKASVTDHFGVDESARLRVKNSDQYCLFHALEISRVYRDQNLIYESKKNKETPPENLTSFYHFKKIMDSEEEQWDLASNLMDVVNIEKNLPDYGIECLAAVQSHYDKAYPGMYRVVVVEIGDGPIVLWKGPLGRRYEVPVLLQNGHFDALKSVSRFFRLENFCIDCESSYQIDVTHSYSCQARCNLCGKMGNGNCISQNIIIICEKCRRTFNNKTCYEQHLEGACKYYKICEKCKQIYQTKHPHTCGDKFCRHCCSRHDPSRSCYIQPIINKKEKKYRIAVYDFETSQDLVLKEGVYKHQICFISLRWSCTECEKGIINNNSCELCRAKDGGKEKKRSWSWYISSDPLEDFINFLLEGFFSQRTEMILYAHNGGRFDGHFVLQRFYEKNFTPKVTMTGLKIYEISIGNMYFRDSYLILQNALDGLPKTFGLSVDEKMFFPYMFCRETNKHTKLQTLPPISDYLPEGMKEEKNAKFLEWYNNNKNAPFDLQKELAIYFENDTLILLKSMTTMRKLLMDITKGFDPLHKATSIAGIAMSIYRHMFMKPDTISIIPEGGYEKNDRASDKAIKLMEWLSMKRNIIIKHAGNGREHRIGKWKVDGFCENEKRVFEFLGCYYHSHPSCTEPEDPAPNGKLNRINYAETIERIEQLRAQGYAVECFWECEVDSMLKGDSQMKAFFEDHNTKGAINPREGFFGGRTMAYKLFEEATPDREITYLDVTSLYPWVNFAIPYPTGTPNIIIPEQQKVLWDKPADVKMEGLYKVKVVPPQNLLHPVLPERISPDDPRLIFPLCIKCTGAGPCRHTPEQRSWTTTVTSIELREALSQGYSVIEVYRIWHYDKMDNLFRGYVQAIMRIKIESSGFPSHLVLDEDKQAWKREYLEKLGIEVDLANVKYNGGLRHISKLLLNSLWGKFGQRNTLMKNVIINTPSNYFNIINNKKLRISQIIPTAPSSMRLIYQEKNAYIKENFASNPVVALWTTSAARHKLYQYMKIVRDTPGCVILYTDTDSIIFSHPRGKCPINVGGFLGDMTKEYDDCVILEYCAAGPKQYALKLQTKEGKIKYILKIRGITMNFGNREVLTYEKFRDMTLKHFNNNINDSALFSYSRIGPDKFSNVLTRAQTKFYRPINNKGYIIDNVVYPFGYLRKE